MSDAHKKKAGWKHKIVDELIKYWINVLYLTIYFGVFTSYRRLILAQYEISYEDYGISLIKALVLAKVIMIGDVLRLGRGFKDKPLIVPTLYRTILFSGWIWLFGVIEHTIRGLLQGKGLFGGFEELMGKGEFELLARCLVTFVAFLPFFAFRELGRVLGEGKISELFFRRKAATESDLLG